MAYSPQITSSKTPQPPLIAAPLSPRVERFARVGDPRCKPLASKKAEGAESSPKADEALGVRPGFLDAWPAFHSLKQQSEKPDWPVPPFWEQWNKGNV